MEYGIVAIVAVVVLAAVVILWLRSRSSAPAERPRPDDARTPGGREQPAADGGLRARLSKTRSAIAGSFSSVFGSGEPDERWQDLEDALILADVGPTTSADIVDRVKRTSPATEEELRSALSAVLVDTFGKGDRTLNTTGAPGAVIVVGVNGSGKTTTIAKLASDLVASGSSVVLGAADTFRAAADSQLKVWGDRLGVDVVTGDHGADPASVAFAAVTTAAQGAADVVIVDTAGRLHADANLMSELQKIARVVEREAGALSEVLLVLDGSTGQNGIAQARAFTDAVGVTGVVVTKLDGTAKGGVAVAVERELGVPIKYIGLGEGIDDLVPFDPNQFVEALIS